MSRIFQLDDPKFGISYLFEDESVKFNDIGPSVEYGAEQVSSNGTLLIYFSGHGSEGGDFYDESGEVLDFKRDVFPFIRKARMDGNGSIRVFRRLIMIVDSCFSGRFANGIRLTQEPCVGCQTTNDDSNETQESNVANQVIDRELNSIVLAVKESGLLIKSDSEFSGKKDGSTQIEFQLAAKGEGVARQVIVFAASRAKEEASFNLSEGGFFTSALAQVFSEAKNRGARNRMTIGEFLDRVTEETHRKNWKQTPQYRILGQDADNIENECLWN
jgi:hypothetical protein